MKLRLSYSDGISVVPLDMTVEQLRREPVWKIRLSALRRYAPSYREADVLFSLSMEDPGAKRVVELLQQAASFGVLVGAVVGALVDDRKPVRGVIAGGILGALMGYGGSFAWQTRPLTLAMARQAGRRIGNTRDRHWLDRNPINYG